MKNSRECPKCRSVDIVRIPGKRAQGGAGNLIDVSGWHPWNTVKPVRYLCGVCGYMEEWLDTPNDIARVKAKYRE